MCQCSRQHSEDPSASPSVSALKCLDHNSKTLNSRVATEQAWCIYMGDVLNLSHMDNHAHPHECRPFPSSSEEHLHIVPLAKFHAILLCLAGPASLSIALACPIILHTMINGALEAPGTVCAALGRSWLAVTGNPQVGSCRDKMSGQQGFIDAPR